MFYFLFFKIKKMFTKHDFFVLKNKKQKHDYQTCFVVLKILKIKQQKHFQIFVFKNKKQKCYQT